ncbi:MULTISPECIES: DUF4244 domain-containing protein [Kitasatospora]|uniref:DUF4244 domain-containing protein n=1 Tax=Kitasatospora setae (strain ATCC 33774 / DSM 43861 / JCM 3304 / KCC A-0304 / NBRC 14216 / KM-6054) TaxID=452652 RepID=E4NDW1_KITSK|nr:MULTISPECIES: DUF4244 domain-containing protein [Kitasatospora]BAJ29392.1 hypothetical protein KSE_35880 [Kitasatospora setae KM-6054]
MMKFVRAVRPTAAVLVVHRLAGWFRRRYRRVAAGPPDAGMNTAEYAIGTVAACAFAAVLYKVVTSETVSGALSGLLERSLHGV